MRWYKRLYIGENAKKRRFSVMRAVKKGRSSGYYLLTPASNPKNLLDIYPAKMAVKPSFKEQDLLIVGVASDEQDAAHLAGQIIMDIYKKTGGYRVNDYFSAVSGQKEN